MTKNKLTKAAEKRLESVLDTVEELARKVGHDGYVVDAIKLKVADELATQKKDLIEKLIVIRDIEKGEAKDLRKTRAGYNINLLIEELSNTNN